MSHCGESECNSSIDDENQKIKCSGFCKEEFHLACVGVTKRQKQSLNDNIIFCCNNCATILKSGLAEIFKQQKDFISKIDENFQKIKIDMFNLVDKRFLDLEEKIEEISEKLENSDEISAVLEVKKVDPVIVVKPKDKRQNSEKTKNDIKKNINKSEVKVNGVLKASEGGVIIRCKDEKSTEEIKKTVEKKMSKNYETKIPIPKKPRLKIVGVDNPPKTLAEIKQMLLDDNEEIFNSENDLEVLSVIEIKRGENNNYSNVIIEINGAVYKKIMSTENPRLNFDWNKCKVFDAINVKRCYKCCSFSHMASECESDIVCFKCGLNHKSSGCKSQIEKCINCVKSKSKLRNTQVDISHNAMSKACPIYQKIVNRRKRSIKYE